VKIRGKPLDGSTDGTSDQPKSVPQDVLESWKEIAAFIGRDERTAMRWAKEQGMPVQRSPGKRGRIHGSRSEISSWLAGSGDSAEPAPESAVESTKQFGKQYIFVGLALLAILGIAATMWIRAIKKAVLPASVVFSADSMQAKDADGRVLWTHSFSAPLDPRWAVGDDVSRLDDLVRITDLLGNGDREIIAVAPVQVGPNPQNSVKVEIDCFRHDGRLLWSYSPHETLKFGDSELGGPWRLSALTVSRRGHAHSIYAAFNHHLWGNSFIVEIDPATGHGIVRFVNTGTTQSLDELQTAAGTYLLVGGFNNEQDGGSLAVVEETRQFAKSPQTAGTRHECVSCPPGVPDYYFVFPRSELDRLRKDYENPVIGMNVGGSGFDVVKCELWQNPASRNAQAYYAFRNDPTIHPISLRYSSRYDMLHGEAQKGGELDHSLAACPERLHPEPVKVWTPSDGWKELSIKPSAP
jgi:hypothetical protein